MNMAWISPGWTFRVSITFACLSVCLTTVGGRSSTFVTQPAQKGAQVQNDQSSILEWVNAGLPVVRLDGQPTIRVHTDSNRVRFPDQFEPVVESSS
jgi:hypothetical protein